MTILPIVIAPDPILSQKALKVEQVNKDIIQNIEDMKETLLKHKAIGIAANMVGILKRIIVVNISNDDKNPQLVGMINPEMVDVSAELQTINEASLSYPFIAADVTRSKMVKVKYLDENGKEQILEAADFTATVVQHEMDYLDGLSYLDHLSKLKRSMLLKKMKKMVRVKPHN